MSETKFTPAGQKLLNRFLELEVANALTPLVGFRREPLGDGMPVPFGSGAALSAAEKLARDGLIRLVGARHHRWILITDAGRAALAKARGDQ